MRDAVREFRLLERCVADIKGLLSVSGALDVEDDEDLAGELTQEERFAGAHRCGEATVTISEASMGLVSVFFDGGAQAVGVHGHDVGFDAFAHSRRDDRSPARVDGQHEFLGASGGVAKYSRTRRSRSS